MSKKLVNPASLYDGNTIGLSHGVIDEASQLLFVSGQIAGPDADHTVAGQLRDALENLRTVLQEAGSDVAGILSLRIYVRGEVEEHMDAVAPVLGAFLGTVRVAMTGIGVASLVSRQTLVEVEAVARTGKH
jgi:enamine deaminase RidA (YjgF/YER057c/UK114 family)